MIRQVLQGLLTPRLSRSGFLGAARFSNNKKPEEKQDEEEDDIDDRKVNPEEENESSAKGENRRNLGWTIWRILFWSSTALFSYNYYLVVYHNKKTPVEKQQMAVPYVIDAAKYAYKQYNDAIDFFTKPPIKKFLPDPVHVLMQPKTLVINLTGTVLVTNFRFGKGLQIIKRPGLDDFLKRLSRYYEIVIYTDDEYSTIMNVMPAVDPRMNMIIGAFGRQSMVLSNGGYFKDLGYLNRDMKNVVVIDKSADKVAKQKRNVITLPEYKGEQDDKELIELLPLLEHLASHDVRDVRPVLESLGENPYKRFAQMHRKKKQKIQNKTSLLGMFKKPEKQAKQQQ